MDAVVYDPITTAKFVEYVLKHHQKQPTTLIVCSERHLFLESLHDSIIREQETRRQADGDAENIGNATQTPLLFQRTLATLRASRSIKLVFCDSIPALLAYLSTLPKDGADSTGRERVDIPPRHGNGSKRPMLALVGLLAQQWGTGSYSAQGLSKTLAVAVEAAIRCDMRLVIVQGIDRGASRRNILRGLDEQGDLAMVDFDEGHGEARPVRQARRTSGEMQGSHEDNDAEIHGFDPWAEEVPVLDATSRARGGEASRRMMGQTVTTRSVVSRWCVFKQLPQS